MLQKIELKANGVCLVATKITCLGYISHINVVPMIIVLCDKCFMIVFSLGNTVCYRKNENQSSLIGEKF